MSTAVCEQEAQGSCFPAAPVVSGILHVPASRAQEAAHPASGLRATSTGLGEGRWPEHAALAPARVLFTHGQPVAALCCKGTVAASPGGSRL